ncbi:hypothetical protein [Pyramidobacter piscolens]|uniref:hypothetical protein n=1 Tax=Pyramidobacter piscolens TaxID=638849 RepID=UPI002AAF5B14|nr:hypothetical protein [Pyramidobacter piscolens]
MSKAVHELFGQAAGLRIFLRRRSFCCLSAKSEEDKKEVCKLSRKLFNGFFLFVVCLSVVAPAWSKGKGKTKAKETPPPVIVEAPEKKEEKPTPYFTGFNGYPWGTPLETLKADTKPETRVGRGFDGYVGRTLLVTNLKNSVNLGAIKQFHLEPLDGFQYFFAAYSQKDTEKYPFVCYILKDGKLVGGSFHYEWDGGNTGDPRMERSLQKIKDIIAYVPTINKGALKTVTPRYNAFGATLEYDTLLYAWDDVGGIIASTKLGVGLEKRSLDSMLICVMANDYLIPAGLGAAGVKPAEVPTL